MVVAYFDAEGTDFYGIFGDYLELRGGDGLGWC